MLSNWNTILPLFLFVTFMIHSSSYTNTVYRKINGMEYIGLGWEPQKLSEIARSWVEFDWVELGWEPRKVTVIARSWIELGTTKGARNCEALGWVELCLIELGWVGLGTMKGVRNCENLGWAENHEKCQKLREVGLSWEPRKVSEIAKRWVGLS